eukprot:355081_1
MKQTVTNLLLMTIAGLLMTTICLLVMVIEQNNGHFNALISRSPRNARTLLAAGGPPDNVGPEGVKYDIVIGSIIMWSGSIDNIPENWALCNGSASTPDLTDKFVIGAGNLFNVNDVGGQFNIILNQNQLPSHNHIHSHIISDNNINIGVNGLHKHNTIEGQITYRRGAFNHQHNIDLYTMAPQGAGSQGVKVVDIGIGGAGLLNSPGGNQRSLFASDVHQHRIVGNTGWTSPAAHWSDLNFDISDLSADNNGSHIHSINGITDINQDGDIGNNEQTDITNPYYSLCYIMKISNLDNSGGSPVAAAVANEEMSADNDHKTYSNSDSDSDSDSVDDSCFFLLFFLDFSSLILPLLFLRFFSFVLSTD